MKPSLVIVGLGNPGAAYEKSRHNIGFQALDVLAHALGDGGFSERQKFLGETCDARVITVPVLLVKPHTYMNSSGDCVGTLVDFFKLNPKEQLLVVSDDIDLPLGEVRLRMKGGPGTHNGLKSIIARIGEDFPRIRIGLGKQPEGADLATWVLSGMTAEEQKTLNDAYATIPDLIKEYVLNTVKES